MTTRQLRISLSASGEIDLTIPSPSGGSHSVEIPCTTEGLRLLRSTLRDFTERPDATIGHNGHLTQHQVDVLLRSFKPQPKPKPEPVDIEALDLSDLQL